ncbi:hypothetical protein ACH5RR_000600 [Cinchona calisaya]|uniref:Neprosin PEP catalytic domain-containing protein n=1 Tax=Cinchona calisaya TaxID=153742 RepID=A0ABD3B182_9GENT
MDLPFSRVKIMTTFYYFMLLSIANLCYASRFNLAREKIEVEKTLNLSKKIPLKSIKSPDGDIIDCIDIYHQPAFDHPLLKNHTIQMRPSYHPEKGLFGENKMFDFKARSEEDTIPIFQLWQLNGSCPEGTIPIRRTSNADVLRASSIKKNGKKKQESIPDQLSSANRTFDIQSGHEHVIAYAQGSKYYGAKAIINVWKPQIQSPNEFSGSQIWIIGGSDSNLNTVEAGWMAHPKLFGDDRTRLFTYWTSDGYHSTGCYNLLCSGFIQVSQKISLGAVIKPISSYHGSQFDITLLIWKDPREGGWWLQYWKEVIGYWPQNLFQDLALYDSASLVEWGGEVLNTQSDGQHTTTQMGSGHFPEEKFGGASFFKNIKVVDEHNSLRPPSELGTVVDKPKCYNIALGKSNDWGNFFYYGGPGRSSDCP